jgi:hypothetical protein
MLRACLAESVVMARAESGLSAEFTAWVPADSAPSPPEHAGYES